MPKLAKASTAGRKHRRNRVQVALVGVDTSGNAPGGIATVSRSLMNGFAVNPRIEIKHIPNFDEGTLQRRLAMGGGAVWQVVRRRREIDIVHIQVATGLSIERDLLLALASALMRIPVVAHFHGAGQVEDYEKGSSIHRMAYWALLRVSTNLVLGPRALHSLHLANTRSRMLIVPNGITFPEGPVPFSEDIPTFVFVGRLGKRKGIFDLLEAVDSLAKGGVNLRLLILGDGDIEEVTRRVMSNERLRERTEILGWQDHEGTLAAIKKSWALILPSYAEGLPMAVLEAMACGRSVIASRVGELEAMIDEGVTGFLVEPGDVSELAKCINQLVNNPGLARSLGNEAFIAARRKYSISTVLDQLEEIYLSLIA